MKLFNKIMYLSLASALAAGATGSFAGGFAIGTQSGSGTGNAFAGGAAVTEDASVVWSNPAGMTALPMGMHITEAVHVVKTSFKFNNTGSTGAFNLPGAYDGSDGGGWHFIPNVFFAMSLTPDLRIGVGLNSPFGLKTEYDPGWRGQLTGLKSEIRTFNLNPSIAYKINNVVSVGVGFNIQRIDAELTSAANATGTNIFRLAANDWGYGYNVGTTIQPTNSTRIGLHYRSAIKYKLYGDANFSATPAADGPVAADLRTPDSASLSVLQQVTPQLDLMGDATWTKWSNLQQLAILRGTALPAIPSLTFQWKDTWRFGLGASYKLNSQVKLRTGIAYDQTPTNDQFRTPRLPDQNRTWVAFGVQYKPTKQGTLEFAYAHEFVKTASVNVPVTGQTTCVAGCLVGNFKDKADIVSLQYSHAF